MTMMKTLSVSLAILSLGTSGAAMAATDGALGATSTGSFTTTLNVVPPTGTQVQVLGLDDVDFGTVNTSLTLGTDIGTSPMQAFCLNRSDSGPVRVSFSQLGVGAGNSLRLIGPVGQIPLTLGLFSPVNGAIGNGAGVSTDSPIDVAQSGSGCTSSSPLGTAHGLQVSPSLLPSFATTALSGAYIATFTVTVSVP